MLCLYLQGATKKNTVKFVTSLLSVRYSPTLLSIAFDTLWLYLLRLVNRRICDGRTFASRLAWHLHNFLPKWSRQIHMYSLSAFPISSNESKLARLWNSDIFNCLCWLGCFEFNWSQNEGKYRLINLMTQYISSGTLRMIEWYSYILDCAYSFTAYAQSSLHMTMWQIHENMLMLRKCICCELVYLFIGFMEINTKAKTRWNQANQNFVIKGGKTSMA